MPSRFRSALLAAHAVGALALATQPTQAGNVVAVSLTLDDPFPTLVIPSSGSFVHTFTGTLSFSTGFNFAEAELFFPFVNGAVPGLSGEIINTPYTAANNGGLFTGGLFTIEVSSTDLPGVYNEQFGGGPATFGVKVAGALGGILEDTEPYTVTLVAAPTSVPESSPIIMAAVLLGMGAAARSWMLRK